MPDLEDVAAMALPVLSHRVVLNFQAEAEGSERELVDRAADEGLARSAFHRTASSSRRRWLAALAERRIP
jgi:hypothetical protein